MCLNNLPALIPLRRSYMFDDMVTFGTIGYVSSMSAISHLLENHKHGMPGFIPNSSITSWFFNRLDVLGSALVVLRFSYLYYKKYGFNVKPLTDNITLVIASVLSFMCQRISEYDNKNVSLKNRYLLFHSAWHLSIYPIMDMFLSVLIY